MTLVLQMLLPRTAASSPGRDILLAVQDLDFGDDSFSLLGWSGPRKDDQALEQPMPLSKCHSDDIFRRVVETPLSFPQVCSLHPSRTSWSATIFAPALGIQTTESVPGSESPRRNCLRQARSRRERQSCSRAAARVQARVIKRQRPIHSCDRGVLSSGLQVTMRRH